MNKYLVSFTLLFQLVGLAVSVPSCSQVLSMKNAIDSIFAQNPPMLPTAVRLAFHDCVGGCNGCINPNDANNNGLQNVVAALDDAFVKNNFKNIASKADFYALSGLYAVTKAVRISNQERSGSTTGPCPVPAFNLQWGRTDVASCSTSFPTFPAGTMNANQMFSYFKTTFGFDNNQVVALLGAHTLGKAVPANSGYAGPWKPKATSSFDERYYTRMTNNGWTNKNAAPPGQPPKWQFNQNNDNGLMLNTDFELFYNLTLDSNSKTTCNLNPSCGLTNSCSGTSCPMSSTFAKANLYSKDCTAFINDFKSVFESLLQHGSGSGQLTTFNCPL